jgi:hypothetical protein
VTAALACAAAAAAAAVGAYAPAADAASDAVCRPATSVSAVAGAAHVGRASVTIARSEGGNGMPQCTFAASGHKRPSVTINIDNGPQVQWRLMRTVVEASQIFGVPPKGWSPPIGLNGLGPYASWFPELSALMATNGADLVTVGVDWPQASRKAKISLARQIMIPFRRRSR